MPSGPMLYCGSVLAAPPGERACRPPLLRRGAPAFSRGLGHDDCISLQNPRSAIVAPSASRVRMLPEGGVSSDRKSDPHFRSSETQHQDRVK